MEKSNAATVAICDTGPLIHHPCSVFPLPSSILHFPFCAFRSPPSVLGLLFSIFRRPFCAIRYPFSAFRPPSSVSSPPPSALRPLLSALCSLALRHSAFRNPHSTLEKFRIPHSAFRTYPRTFVRSYAFSLHHSAFRICHWKGPFVRLCSFRPQSPPPPAPLLLTNLSSRKAAKDAKEHTRRSWRAWRSWRETELFSRKDAKGAKYRHDEVCLARLARDPDLVSREDAKEDRRFSW